MIVGHWTSRVTDRDGGKRLAYGRAMYGAYLAVERSTPGPADVVLCGDFNDEPTDNSVILGLRATGDASAVLATAGADQPRLLDLLSGRDPKTYGTYYYGKDWQIFDHIVVSPGLLDDRAGPSCPTRSGPAGPSRARRRPSGSATAITRSRGARPTMSR